LVQYYFEFYLLSWSHFFLNLALKIFEGHILVNIENLTI